MKYSLKNEYKELLKEFRVSIETDDGYYDYEFDDNQNVDFKNLKFINKSDNKTEYNSDFKKEIFKTPDYTTYVNPSRSKPKGKKSFTLDPNTGSLLQYVILKAIKNIIIYEKQAYGKLCDEYVTSTKHLTNQDTVLKSMLESILDFLNKKYEEKNENLYIKTLNAAVEAIKAKEQNYDKNKILEIVKSPDRADDMLSALATGGGAANKIKNALLKYFKRDITDEDRNKTASIQHTLIANEYMANGPDALSLFYRGKNDYEKNNTSLNQKNIRIRSEVKSIEDVKSILAQANSVQLFKKINSKAAANRKGKGEFLCHMLFNTSNACLPIEPDVVIPNVGSFSVKSMASASARTGENIDKDIKSKMELLFKMLKSDYQYQSQITKSQLEVFAKNSIEKDKNKIKKAYNKLKIAIITEHDAEGLILHGKDGNLSVVLKNEIDPDCIYLSEFKNNRWAFTYSTAKTKNISYENVLRNINQSDNKSAEFENSSYMPQGKVLKEVYSNLFEGGLGGHMSHPYEVLDKTPKELIKRIKEYGVPQKIIEKVDGQNLFFTITKEGQVMFARNSNDMAYDDLIEKFTNHGAEKPFVQGGTAIKRAVDDWVSSNPDFTLNDIETIFHPAEGSNERYQSFINFEIMHPESPNQIEYDKKYIVFHSIIDFEYDQTGKRSEVIGSNSDQRLQKLFNSLKNHIEQYDFELASNREVEINVLTSVQISDYIEKINKVADTLGITEDETLEEGVISHISNKLKQSGVNLDHDSSKVLFDFVLYGEDSKGTKLTGRAVIKGLDKEVAKVLRELGLTNKSKAAAMISRILSPFKGIFVDLGIDLLKGVESAYMSRETGEKNIKDITEKLRLAISDYESYMTNTPEDEITNIAKRLQPYVDKIKQIGIDNAIASPVEGGVYSVNSDLEKITGGFAPMNQILGAAYRDRENIFPEFQDQYLQKESKNSLKKVFSSIF